MINLEKVSGLPISVTEDCKLKFNQPIVPVEPKPRTLADMQKVLMDPTAQSDRTDMYYMYRNVHFPDHNELIAQIGLTYDITVIPPAVIGQEFNKTVGHYHANSEGSMIAYPEIYEVLHGKALVVLQKMDPEFKKIISVLVIEASTGDKVIYPPNYGHIIVNTGNDVLVTANWVADKFERMYRQVEDYQGMAYYVVKDGDKGYNFVPNPKYGEVPKVRILTDKYMNGFNIMQPGSMYLTGTNNPKTLEFLTDPQKYAVELSSITS